MARLSRLLLAILLLSNIHAEAQLLSRKTARITERPPKAILVELSTYSRKMQYYTKIKKQQLVTQLETDVHGIMENMLLDFQDNFDYCPVYYFIDTNSALVREKQFAGILLDAHLKPVDNITLQPDDPYSIVLFAKTVKDAASYNQSNNSDPMDAGYNLTSSKYRLIVLDKEFKEVNKPLPNGLNNISGGKLKKPASEYIYYSPTFDIYYKPYAQNFSAKLLNYYGPYPYK